MIQTTIKFCHQSVSIFSSRSIVRLCGLILLAVNAWAQQPSTPAATGPTEQADAPANAPNAITRNAVQRGVLNCAARVEQVTAFTGFGPQAAAVLLLPPTQVDQRMFSIAMEIPAGASSNSWVDMSFAPNQANGCGGGYTAVSYWNKSCEELQNTQFSGLRKLPAMKQDIVMLDGGVATKVFLMKAGFGCISIKKEIVL